MLDFSCKYEYERLRDDPGLYMDNDIYWGEILNHTKRCGDESGTMDFEVGTDVYLPQAAEKLGYKQAHIEAFIGMKCMGYNYAECRKYLNLNEKQIGQLVCMEEPVIRFRIFPSSMVTYIREIASKHFKIGYAQAYQEIGKRIGDINLVNSIRACGIKEAMRVVRILFPNDLVAEYCELYKGVV